MPSTLAEIVQRQDAAAARGWYKQSAAGDAVHAAAHLDHEDRSSLLALLSPEEAAGLLALLPGDQAIEAMEGIDAAVAAEIVEALPSNDRADLIRSLGADAAEAILIEVEATLAADIRRLAAYRDDQAGSLMVSEYLAFPSDFTVRQLLDDIERNTDEYADYNIQYTYVVGADQRLLGVLPLRNVILAKRSTPVGDIMIADPIAVRDTATVDDVRSQFREHGFLGFPVVDQDGRLVGVIEAGDVAKVDIEDADERYRQSQGIVGGEELRSMPLFTRSRRRLAWLSANIVLNIIAASMIALHQDTLEAVIALAVFLPIISDMSGCSGNQAVAVTMRELTLGVTRPRDAVRVFVKEILLGLINGTALGLLIGAVAFIWKGNLVLSAVVGTALALNTTIAVCVGGLVPLLLKKFRADPALASGPILTTITDMCGFFIVLTMASSVLSYLT